MGTCCSKCKKTPCGCNQYGCATAQPFYSDVPCCEEDNCQKIYYNQFSLGLQIQSSWNIPQCGGAAVLSVPGVTNIPIGSYLWNDSFGYYEVVSFDAVLSQVSIQNPCFSINSPAGTEVPTCTTFVIAPPPCCETFGQSGVFLAVDFTAPTNGTCIDITVTEETGLIAGNEVQIGTGVYLLSAIKANNIITICNEGEGIIPGTPVIAKNVSGQFQYPLQLITVNDCSQTPVASGKVKICDSSTGTTLSGTTNGYLLTLIDSTTGKAEYNNSEATARAAADTVLQTQITNNLAVFGALKGNVYSSLSAFKAGAVLGASPTFVTNIATLTINNTSVLYPMAVLFTAIARLDGSVQGANSANLIVDIDLQIDTLGSGYISSATRQETLFVRSDADTPMSRQRTWTGFTTIPISTAGTINARCVVTWIGAVGSIFGMSSADVALVGIGVAV